MTADEDERMGGDVIAGKMSLNEYRAMHGLPPITKDSHTDRIRRAAGIPTKADQPAIEEERERLMKAIRSASGEGE